MNKLRLITYILRMVLAIVILAISSISIYMDMDAVWKCVFCLALINIVDLAEKEI